MNNNNSHNRSNNQQQPQQQQNNNRQQQQQQQQQRNNTSKNKQEQEPFKFFDGLLLQHQQNPDPNVYSNPSMDSKLDSLSSSLQFYCGNIERSGDCCFNHVIGLPEKDGKPKELFDYEIDIVKLLEQGEKYLWIKKATGLGITEFFLRWIGWRCFTDPNLQNSNVCIITGPRIELAVTLVKRFKSLFEDFLTFEDKETVCNLNTVHVEAFPSHHLSTMRGLTDVKFILIDEADFFPPGQQEEVRSVSERYIAKSDPYIIMVSTPNAPGALFEKMENDRSIDFRYKRLFLDYRVGLGKIYTEQEIKEAMRSPSFKREYDLSYGFGIGNVFLPAQIDNSILLGDTLDPLYTTAELSTNYTISIGVDPGFGSSAFSYTCTAVIDSKVVVLDSQEYERADFVEMLYIIFDLMQIRYPNAVVFVDGANPSFISRLKVMIDENSNYLEVMQQAKREHIDYAHRMRVIPVNFNQSGRQMLTLLQSMLSGGVVAINRKFDKLVTQMRIAKTEPSGNLDKDVATMDSLDSLRLSCFNWTYTAS